MNDKQKIRFADFTFARFLMMNAAVLARPDRSVAFVGQATARRDALQTLDPYSCFGSVDDGPFGSYVSFRLLISLR